MTMSRKCVLTDAYMCVCVCPCDATAEVVQLFLGRTTSIKRRRSQPAGWRSEPSEGFSSLYENISLRYLFWNSTFRCHLGKTTLLLINSLSRWRSKDQAEMDPADMEDVEEVEEEETGEGVNSKGWS